jgi:hypothetical protein
MKTEHQMAREHFQNEWVKAQAWAKKVDGGFMPMVGHEEANYMPLPTEKEAMDLAVHRRQALIDAWK